MNNNHTVYRSELAKVLPLERIGFHLKGLLLLIEGVASTAAGQEVLPGGVALHVLSAGHVSGVPCRKEQSTVHR